MIKRLFILLLTLCTIVSNSQAQYIIKNGGFENWQNVPGSTTKEYPEKWVSYPGYLNDANTYVALSKTSDAHSGNWALKFASRPILSVESRSYHLLDYSMIPNSYNNYFLAGDSISYIPKKLKIWYKFKPDSLFSDTVSILVNFSPNGGGAQHFFIPTDTFSHVEIPIIGWNQLQADTVRMEFNYMSHYQNSTGYLIVDDMEFEGEYTSVDDIQLNNFFTLYPNPVSEFLYLKSSSTAFTINTYRIYALDGRQLMEGKPDANKINVQGLPKGNYVIRFTTNKGNGNLKFVKS